MPTDTNKKPDTKPFEIEYTETTDKLSFFDKLKYLFSKLFESIGSFFRNLFSFQRSNDTTIYTQPTRPINMQPIKESPIDKQEGEEELNEDKSRNDIDVEKTKIKKETPFTHEEDKEPQPEDKKPQPDIPEGETKKEKDTFSTPEEDKEPQPEDEEPQPDVPKENIDTDDVFKEDNSNVEEKINDDTFEVPVIPIEDIGDDCFDYEDENAPTTNNNDVIIINDISETPIPDAKNVGDEILNSDENDTLITEDDSTPVTTQSDDIFEDEPVEIKTIKEMFLSDIRNVDTRAVSVTSQKDTVSILFELEDESSVVVELEQNGNIRSLNKIISDFDAVVDDIGFSSTTKTTVPTTSSEIGFDATLKGLTSLIQQRPNIINEIYNSKTEIERREKQMIEVAKQLKVDNIEDLKDILLGYMETENRNLIVYDMQDKTLCIKLPTNIRDDALQEVGREFVINLTDMTYNIKVEIMDFSVGGGCKTEIEEIDIDTMDSKFKAIYEATKANKEFFDKDLSTDGPVDEIEYEEYIESDYNEGKESNYNSRNADRKKTQERNRAIRNKEMSRTVSGDDNEKKHPKKHHYNPNRDDDDLDL